MRFIARADAMAAAECLDGALARREDSPEAIRQTVGSAVSTAGAARRSKCAPPSSGKTLAGSGMQRTANRDDDDSRSPLRNSIRVCL
jgi:hypothetical protein